VTTAEDIVKAFEAMGLRHTRPRLLIAQKVAEFAASGHDFATDDLWHELQQADPQLGRATVFRAVDILAEHGILDRVTFADGTRRYRACAGASHHHHVTCTACHRVVEIDVCLPPEAMAVIARQTDFALEGHSVELFGRCPACRAAEKAAPPEKI
jgi:Fur family ferric uptake transcriptional regulator